jgi:hypothetical protein
MSTLDPEDQNKLFSACFEGAKQGITFPGKEELKRIKQYYNENKPDKTFDDAIEYILKLDRPPAGFTSAILMATLDEDVFEKLKEEVEKRNSTAKEVAIQILNKTLGDGLAESTKVMETGIIRIIFSKEGKQKINNISSSKKISKNQVINNLIGEEL